MSLRIATISLGFGPAVVFTPFFRYQQNLRPLESV